MIKKRFLIPVLLVFAAAGWMINAYSFDGKTVGKIADVNRQTGEIIVRTPNAAENIFIGDKLYIRIGGEIVIMQSTNPMMSLSKCRLLPAYSRYLSNIVKDMTVYRYEPGLDKKAEDVKKKDEAAAGTVKIIGGIEMVFCPSGTFIMGRDDSYLDGKYRNEGEKPKHQVHIDGFYMGKYEVTQAQYVAVMGKNPSENTENPDNPVEKVSWYDAVEFCVVLSEKSGLKPYYNINKNIKDVNNKHARDKIKWTVTVANAGANGFRLPSEAEWEYACRAGSTGTYYWGDDDSAVYAWNAYNSDSTLHAVGLKKPNAFGLHDMCGNVWEWCFDWYGIRYYATSPKNNPAGESAGDLRILRGGSWSYDGTDLQSFCRFRWYPDQSRNTIGFRIALSQQ